MIATADLRAYLGAASSADPLIASLESSAVLWLEKQTGRYLRAVVPVVRTCNGRGSEILWLADPPVTLASVAIRDSPVSPWVTVVDSDYELDERKLFRLSDVWPKGARNIQISLTVGYDDGAAPGDLVQAVRSLVTRAWSAKTSQQFADLKLGSVIDFSYSKVASTIDGMAETIAAYKVTLWG